MRILTSVPERTMMSLQSFMAGFFPPPISDRTLPIWWQPFFTSVDYKAQILHIDELGCPRYTQYLYAMMSSPPDELFRWVNEDREMLDQLAAWAGVTLDNPLEVMMFAEFLKAQKYLDSSLPEWVIEAYFSTLEKYVAAMFALMHANEEMIRIRGGPLLTEIINNMLAVQSGSEDARPVLVYSAHDMTVLSLAYVLGVQDQVPELPNYSDTFMVDYQDDDTVRVVYMNTERFLNTRTVVNIPGCGTSCSLNTFRNLISGMLVNDVEKLCQL